MKTNLILLATVAASVALPALADPEITNVNLSRDERTHLVTISYDLSEPAIVTAQVVTNGVALPHSAYGNMAGDVHRVVKANTARKVYWKPPTSTIDALVAAGNAEVKLSAWATDDPPDYLAIDLITTNCWRFYVTAEDVPLGVTNKIYKTSKLLMRKIYSKNITWPMGISSDHMSGSQPANDSHYKTNRFHRPHYVTLTSNYYISVYEQTKRQYRNGSCYNSSAYDSNDGYREDRIDDDMRPFSRSFDVMRGQTSSCYWPVHGHNVPASGGIGYLRKKTGLNIDISTEAEWEYACRAGTATALYTGEAVTAANVAKIAWFGANWTNDPVAVAVGKNTDTHAVGLLQPNAWGLYDMLGNAWEICLDVMSDQDSDSFQIDPYQGNDATDPVGPTLDDQAKSKAAGMADKYLYVKYNGRRARRGGATADSTTSSNPALSGTIICAELRKNISSSVGGGSNGYRDVAYRLVLPAVIP